MSADAPPDLRHRITVFRNMGRLDRTISLGIRNDTGTHIAALTISEAKQVAAMLSTLANEERRRKKR